MYHLFLLGKHLHSSKICPGRDGTNHGFSLPLSRVSHMSCRYFKSKGSRKPVKKEHWKYIFVVGAVGYFVSIACQLAGTNLLNSSLASLINAMNPITISILAAILLKEKIRKKNIVSILISLVGVYIILGIGDGSISTLGVILSVLSVVFWSGASIAIRKISSEYDPVQTALYGMCIALVLNIPAAAAENVFVVQSTVTKEAAFACIYLGIFGTAVAHTCWNKGLQLLDASTCSMFYPMQPLASAVLGVLILHEVLTWNFIAGGLVICVGILITVMRKGERKMQTAADLRNLLNKIDHRGYPAYKDTKGIYQFPGYVLSIDHVQGDPFASPSKVSVFVKGKDGSISKGAV